ncbi:MAG: PASTA domain-containing protein [Lachnospiraceae bacterium]|nr:PASTA domain-containing protein [Lachnospiraceae bacterium]
MLKPGMILCDRYEILEVVGAGGMSIVYKARCHRLNRNVAIKVLKPEFSRDQNFVTKFRVEAQASAGLAHPNIVNVYDVYDDEGVYFIVMELVEGITLKDYIAENGRLTMDRAIDFAIQIASGLEAAHESHVIHRDIKPQNIIVSKNGNLKVTDFGIAKAASSNTLTSGAMGSVHYISPEQARGGYSDERSDIYSLGITMYEMVTGRVPFEGDNNVSVALMHIQSDMIPPRQYYPDIYSSFEKVILKATQKKPERRYLTASALIADLKRVQNNPNIDIVVAPTSITNSPTQEWSKEDVQAIRAGVNGSTQGAMNGVVNGAMAGAAYGAMNGYANQYGNGQLDTFNQPFQNEMGEMQPIGGITPITADHGRINQIMNDNSMEEAYELTEEEKAPIIQNIKKIQDYEDEIEDDDDDDDGLQKAVVIGGVLAAVVVAIIVMIFVGNFLGWFNFGDKGKKTTEDPKASTEEKVEDIVMIDVTGVTQEAAIKMLKNEGFKEENILIEMVTDDEAQEGYVVEQSFKEGTPVPSNAKITLRVSAGAEEAIVPDVTGYTDAQACTVITEAGFEYAHAYEYSDEVEKDYVISTTPAANSTAPKGSKVVITVSNGSEKKETVVPNIYGLSKEDAMTSIEAAKLKVGNVTEEHHETIPAGQVISQSPAANSPIEEGQSVDFVVSKGPEEKKVTYTANIAGTITCNDPALDGTAVTVQVLFNGSPVFSQDVTVTSGNTYNISATVPGLEAEGGSADFAMVDGTGASVTGSFTKGAINISYTKVEE